MDSPRNDQRCDSDCRSLDSPKVKAEYYRESVLESPKLVAGLRNLHLDENSQMDESGYYSPGKVRFYFLIDSGRPWWKSIIYRKMIENISCFRNTVNEKHLSTV